MSVCCSFASLKHVSMQQGQQQLHYPVWCCNQKIMQVQSSAHKALSNVIWCLHAGFLNFQENFPSALLILMQAKFINRSRSSI